MKELDPINREKEEIHIVQDAEDQKEYTFIGSMVLHKGCKLWSFNQETLEFKREKFNVEVDEVLNTGQKISFMDLILMRRVRPTFSIKAGYNPNCMYCIAINAKNAARKFNRAMPLAVKALGFQIVINKDHKPGT